MTIKDRSDFIVWCQKNGLDFAEALSIAFVPRGTFKSMFEPTSKVLIPAQHRLFLLTGLEVFKLTEAQCVIYNNLIAKQKVEYWDERIAQKFINDWKTTEKKRPEIEDRLMTSNSKSVDKAELAIKLKAKFFSEEIQNQPAAIVKPAAEIQQSEPDLGIQVDATYQRLHDLLTTGDEGSITTFCKANKTTMRRLYGILVIALDAKPFDAAHIVRTTQL